MAEHQALAFDRDGGIVAFLKGLGADRVGHSRGTFLDHLMGTAALVERWGAGEDACKAALLHSVYGTEYFRGAIVSFDDRDRVRAVAGARAESLAYVFCAFDRSSIFRAIDKGAPYRVARRSDGAPIDVSEADLRDLLCVLWANEIEQAPRTGTPREARAQLGRRMAKSGPFLPEAARRDLSAFCGVASSGGDSAKSAGAEPGLRALLDLRHGTEAFLQKYWPEQIYIAKGAVERLAGLVDHDFDALVKMKKHHTKAFFRGVDGASQSMVIEPGQEKPLYDAGFTIYFHNLSSPQMSEWISALDEELGLVRGHTRVAAFASRRGLGLKPHYDQNDNFVCQAKGTKRWRIWPNSSVKYPTVGYTLGGKQTPTHEVEAEDGFPSQMGPDPQVVDMEPGTVMFMPRGYWHDTETATSESLHFNVQSGLAMWKDAIEYVLTRTSALHREDLRAPLVGLFEGETSRPGFGDELKAKLRQVIDEISESEISIGRQAFFKFIASRRPRG
jgi:hypothetical protein